MQIQANRTPGVPQRLPAPKPLEQPTPAPATEPEDHGLNWKAVGLAALKGAALGASASTMGALGHSLRTPAAGVKYAAVTTGAVVATHSAERIFNNVKDGQHPLRETSVKNLPKAVALGAAGFLGGAVCGGVGGTLCGLAGALGGWGGVVVASAASAVVTGSLEVVRQKLD
ncbi:MAG: hypothetical protein U0931_37255 [Vulcanimicrobiota bacterium]